MSRAKGPGFLAARGLPGFRRQTLRPVLPAKHKQQVAEKVQLLQPEAENGTVKEDRRRPKTRPPKELAANTGEWIRCHETRRGLGRKKSMETPNMPPI